MSLKTNVQVASNQHLIISQALTKVIPLYRADINFHADVNGEQAHIWLFLAKADNILVFQDSPLPLLKAGPEH